jgi:hypothetical protein
MWKDRILPVFDVTLATLPVFMLVLICDPLGWFGLSDFWMMASTGVFVASFIPFLAFVWRETAEDEREEAHLALAGRIAYLSGAVVIGAGIVVQIFAHDIDLWLPGALAAMIMTKIGALAYLRARK